MTEAQLARAIRRALLISLALPIGALPACGGRTVADDDRDAAPDPQGSRDATPEHRDSAVEVDAEGPIDATFLPDGNVHYTDASIIDAGNDAYTNPGCYTEVPDGTSSCGPQILYGYPTSCEYDSNGIVTTRQCEALCGAGFLNCNIQPGTNGAPNQVECFCGGGRAPEGLAAPVIASETELGAYFARMAHLESAAALAFATLERELVQHDAPLALVLAAGRAARDESRHARSMTAMAHRFGAIVPAVHAAPARVRSIEEIAIENAIEGCVRETYGAAVTAYQAEAARDARVRKAMRAIAKDEQRHAALGWEVAAWAFSRLDEAACVRVRAARDGAVQSLAREIATDLSPALTEAAGLPSPARAKRLVAALQNDLWA